MACHILSHLIRRVNNAKKKLNIKALTEGDLKKAKAEASNSKQCLSLSGLFLSLARPDGADCVDAALSKASASSYEPFGTTPICDADWFSLHAQLHEGTLKIMRAHIDIGLHCVHTKVATKTNQSRPRLFVQVPEEGDIKVVLRLTGKLSVVDHGQVVEYVSRTFLSCWNDTPSHEEYVSARELLYNKKTLSGTECRFDRSHDFVLRLVTDTGMPRWFHSATQLANARITRWWRSHSLCPQTLNSSWLVGWCGR